MKKNRLDEVFSVEKLRRAWKETAAISTREPSFVEEQGAGTAQGFAGSAAEASYRRLRATIERYFPPVCSSTLEPLFTELEQLLEARFPPDPQACMLQAERAKNALAIEDLLNRIEDLLEAFEVGSQR
jgi:hypothetical protein